MVWCVQGTTYSFSFEGSDRKTGSGDHVKNKSFGFGCVGEDKFIFVPDGGTIASLQGFAINAQHAARYLHPGNPARFDFMGCCFAFTQMGNVKVNILMNGDRSIPAGAAADQ